MARRRLAAVVAVVDPDVPEGSRPAPGREPGQPVLRAPVDCSPMAIAPEAVDDGQSLCLCTPAQGHVGGRAYRAVGPARRGRSACDGAFDGGGVRPTAKDASVEPE